jgi:hypothetical protein
LAVSRSLVPLQVLDVRELHEGQETLRLLRGQPGRPLDPIGKGNQPARLHQTRRFRNQLRLVRHIAPGVLTPNEVNTGRRQPARTDIGEREADLVVQPGRLAALATAFDDLRRRIHPSHSRHVAEFHQEAHPGPTAAAQVNPLHAQPDARAFGQIHGRLEPADVDLLPHH